MRFQTLAPILWTDNMERSVRFYIETLGFACGLQTPGYSNLTRDAVRIILAAPNAHEKWNGPALTGQLYVGLESADDVDAVWADVKERAEVIYAVSDFDYGMREFAIRDDNGYALSFGAPSRRT